MRFTQKVSLLKSLTLCTWMLVGSATVWSQVTCSSDGQEPPPALLERFISADCAACWLQPASVAADDKTVVLDWIVPSALADEAALSAAATPEAATRLAPQTLDAHQPQVSRLHRVTDWAGAALRVVQGPAVTGYLGIIMSLKLPVDAVVTEPLQAWLAMVEALPAGQEGSPVPRNLVRNVLQPPWDLRESLLKKEQVSFYELRSMNIPVGAVTARLRLVGWVQNTQGQILKLASTACVAENQPPH